MLQMTLDTTRPRVQERLQACGVDPAGLDSYLQTRGVSEYLEGVRSSGERAAKIVSDLLSFSRKSSSKAAPHDLNQLVEQTLDLAATDYDLKKKYDFRNVEIVRELTPDLPDVICDGQQIQQVVLNLVRNAAQAMSHKGEQAGADYQPRLMLRTALVPGVVPGGESMMRLEVEDNGPGIPEAVRSRLFEPFFTTKGVGSGTGLGLWLCWSIVAERHKGRIWVESGADGGSRFVVELPLTQPLME
jgi:signal transduction histidine kinase